MRAVFGDNWVEKEKQLQVGEQWPPLPEHYALLRSASFCSGGKIKPPAQRTSTPFVKSRRSWKFCVALLAAGARRVMHDYRFHPQSYS
jgi:hypothetical protein